MQAYFRVAVILVASSCSLHAQAPSQRELLQVIGDYWNKIYTPCDDSFFSKTRDGTITEVRAHMFWDETTTVASKMKGIGWEGFTGFFDGQHRSYANGKWSDWIETKDSPHGLWPTVYLVERNGHWNFDKSVAAWNVVPFSCSQIPPEHTVREEAAMSASQRSALVPQQRALCDAFAREVAQRIAHDKSEKEASSNPIALAEFQRAHQNDLNTYGKERELRVAEVLGNSFEKWRGRLSFNASNGGINLTLRFDCPAVEDFSYVPWNSGLVRMTHTITVLARPGSPRIDLGSPLAELLKGMKQGDAMEASGRISKAPLDLGNTTGMVFQADFSLVCVPGGRCAGVDSTAPAQVRTSALRPEPAPDPKGDSYQPITVPEEVQQQKLIYHPKAAYSPFAKSARLQGDVRLKVLVVEDGSVGDVELISGNRLLSGSAMQAVKQYRYRPTLVAGVPEKVWTEVVVSFP